nr:nucleotidyltransferase substrate binding protein [Thauera sp. K11]
MERDERLLGLAGHGVDITGSRDATRESFSRGLVQDGEGWMEMIRSRKQTSHTYNEEVANEIAGRIIGTYQPLFVAFAGRMRALGERR